LWSRFNQDEFVQLLRKYNDGTGAAAHKQAVARAIAEYVQKHNAVLSYEVQTAFQQFADEEDFTLYKPGSQIDLKELTKPKSNPWIRTLKLQSPGINVVCEKYYPNHKMRRKGEKGKFSNIFFRDDDSVQTYLRESFEEQRKTYSFSRDLPDKNSNQPIPKLSQ